MILNINKIGMNFGKIAVAAGFLFYLGACTPEGSQEMTEESVEETNAPADEPKSMGEEVNRKVFYTIPSPLELTSIIKKAGAKYDKSVLNVTDKASNYVTQPGCLRCRSKLCQYLRAAAGSFVLL